VTLFLFLFSGYFLASFKERERERETDRQTDRQTDRERQRDREIVKSRVRYIENLDIKNLRGNDQNVRYIEVIVND